MNRKEFFIKIGLLTAGLAFLNSKTTQAKTAKPSSELKPEPASWKSDEICISWVGHSTVLINFYGKLILTDPVLFDAIGFSLLGLTIGPSRYSAPALTIDEIPKPDLLLLSHAHMDHMDYPSLQSLANKYKGQIDVLTAFNTMDVIEDLPWKSLQEIDWGKNTIINDIKIKALKTRHFGWRYPWERDRSKGYFLNGRSYNAYVLERNGKKLLFGGDTALTDDFKKSSEKVDIAIMPIGAYYPWRMNHCSPEEALQMAHDLEAKVFIPIHCKTFKQGMEPADEPMKRLHAELPNYVMVLGLESIGGTFRTA